MRRSSLLLLVLLAILAAAGLLVSLQGDFSDLVGAAIGRRGKDSDRNDLLPTVSQPDASQSDTAVSEGTQGVPGFGRTITLSPGQGAVLSNQESRDAASRLEVDLLCLPGNRTVDLVAGAGPTLSAVRRMRLLRTRGGPAAQFDSLAEVPERAPAAADLDEVHNPTAGMGLLLENNVSPGYARIRIRSADNRGVTFDYDLFTLPEVGIQSTVTKTK